MSAAPTRRDPARWPAYNAAQQGRLVRSLCRRAIDLTGPGEGRTAVDLGCGLGIESAALLAAGWDVLAVDAAPGTTQNLRTTTDPAYRSRLTVRETRFEDLGELPPSGLVYAGYSLPHAAPEVFATVWARVRAALEPGALLAVDLFGDRDSWASDPAETYLSRAEVDALLDGLDVVSLVETEEDGHAFSGPKHWHRFEVLARRPSSAG